MVNGGKVMVITNDVQWCVISESVIIKLCQTWLIHWLWLFNNHYFYNSRMWLVAATKNISQLGNHPQVWLKMSLWNHQNPPVNQWSLQPQRRTAPSVALPKLPTGASPRDWVLGMMRPHKKEPKQKNVTHKPSCTASRSQFHPSEDLDFELFEVWVFDFRALQQPQQPLCL